MEFIIRKPNGQTIISLFFIILLTLFLLSCATTQPVQTPAEWQLEKAEWEKSKPVRVISGNLGNSNEWGARNNTIASKDTENDWGVKKNTKSSDSTKQTSDRDGAINTQSDVDVNIPHLRKENRNAIAVVIGNTNYQKTKKVDYAVNDAQSIKKYLINVFGYKDENIFFIQNASKTDFELHFGNEKSHKGILFNAVKEGKSDIFVYYSGHGAPGLKDKKGYFIPIEADPHYLELTGYPADVLFIRIYRKFRRGQLLSSLTLVFRAQPYLTTFPR